MEKRYLQKRYSLAALVVGFSSMLAQIVFLREAISGFYGNELVLGIILGNWLLLAGIGGYVGRSLERFNGVSALMVSQILMAITILPSIFLVRVLRIFIATPGEMLDPSLVFLYSVLVLAPFCLLSGMQFTLLCSVLSKERDRAQGVGNVYITTTVGNILGGLLFSYLLVMFLDSFQSAYLIVFLNLVSALVLSNIVHKRIHTILAFLLAVIAISSALTVDLQGISTRALFPNQNLVYDGNSIYGNLIVTEFDRQYNFYENSIPLFSTGNEFSNEYVHYAMLQYPGARRVLLISGGVAGTTKEVLKYPVERVDYVELDPKLIELGRRFTSNLDDERVSVINADGRFYVKTTKEMYDVVIIDLPEPESIQINRFYTVEFFRELKGILSPAGVVSISLSSAENYLSPELREFNAGIYHTLKQEFGNVIVIPGDTNFFIASDSRLDYDYLERLNQSGIESALRYYLPGKLTPERIEKAVSLSGEGADINSDFKPSSYRHYQKLWLSLFGTGPELIAGVALLLLLLTLFATRFKPVPLAILMASITGMGLEFILIASFQILYGSLYYRIGVIITAFMAGLVLGAGWINSRLDKADQRRMSKVVFLIGIYSLLLPGVLLLLQGIRESSLLFLSVEILFPLLTAMIGILAGIEFPLAVKIYMGGRGATRTAGLLYALDLVGACIGTWLVSILLIPVFGIIHVCFILSAANILVGIYLWVR